MFTKHLIESIRKALRGNPNKQEIKALDGVLIVRESNEALLNKYRNGNWVQHGTVTFLNHHFAVFIG